MADITILLARAHGGDAQARNELFECVYGELGALARRKLANEAPFTNLDASSLVHEAYLRLTQQQELPGENRRMFFAYAAHVMRHLIVDYVRRRGARKRGAGMQLTFVVDEAEAPSLPLDLEALDAALQRLAAVDQRAHQIVEMHYFGGLTINDIADLLQIAPATVKRDWQKARAFLYTTLQAGG